MPNNSNRVNYIMATWGGSRRGGWTYGNYTYKHLKLLESIDCNVDQITVMWPQNNQELYSYCKYMESIDGSDLNGIPIKVIKVPNRFQSYGQYISAFKKFGHEFDYFIFTEDDYIPVINNFDQLMVDQFEKMFSEKRCGYVCGASFPSEYLSVIHAAISWGISRSDILHDVEFDFQSLQERVNGIGEYPKYQFLFSAIFLNSRYTICDFTDKHTVGFLYKDGTYKYWGDGPELIAPMQDLEPDYRIYSKRFEELHKDGLRLF